MLLCEGNIWYVIQCFFFCFQYDAWFSCQCYMLNTYANWGCWRSRFTKIFTWFHNMLLKCDGQNMHISNAAGFLGLWFRVLYDISFPFQPLDGQLQLFTNISNKNHINMVPLPQSRINILTRYHIYS